MPGSSILGFFLVCAVFTYFKEVVYHDQAFLDFFLSVLFSLILKKSYTWIKYFGNFFRVCCFHLI